MASPPLSLTLFLVALLCAAQTFLPAHARRGDSVAYERENGSVTGVEWREFRTEIAEKRAAFWPPSARAYSACLCNKCESN